jgi:hypothetical protein
MKSLLNNLSTTSQNKSTNQCTTRLMMLTSMMLKARLIQSLNMNKVFTKKRSQSIFITTKMNKILLLTQPIKSQVYIKRLQ